MTRRILALALSALLVCVAATAQTDESKRPVKKRQATTKTETKRSSAKEKKTRRTAKRLEPKHSSNPKANIRPKVESFYTNNGMSFKIGNAAFEMVRVEAGTFRMGATGEQGGDAYSDERPVHSVTLDSYYIGKTEVTQALWKAVMGSNPSHFQGDNLPVECVSWNDCQTFIEKLNALTGRSFRLPTEAEWEFACRGGNNSRGYKYSGSNDLNRVAWYDDNSSNRTHTVATKAPNELGIYDMSGNVYEWCADWYGNYSGNQQWNPAGPTSGSYRVFRGGGWDGSAGCCRSSYRAYYFPSRRNDDLGLRLAL